MPTLIASAVTPVPSFVDTGATLPVLPVPPVVATVVGVEPDELLLLLPHAASTTRATRIPRAESFRMRMARTVRLRRHCARPSGTFHSHDALDPEPSRRRRTRDVHSPAPQPDVDGRDGGARATRRSRRGRRLGARP